MTDAILILMTPYLYATLLSLIMSAVVIFSLKLVNKQAYRTRTIMLVTPLVGSFTIMAWVSSFCFIHWLSTNYPTLSHTVCSYISPGSLRFICTSLVTLAFTSFSFAVSLSMINYYLGDKIAMHLFRAKPFSKSQAKETYETLNRLSRKAGVKTPKLCFIERSSPIIFTVGRRNTPTVILSVGLLETLSPEELEASLAHEISHIKNNDGLIRTLASCLKFAAPFNFVSYLIEPAIYREREFLADEASVTLTKKPSALISALIKISEAFAVKTKGGYFYSLAMGFFLESPLRGGLFNKHPPLEERLNRLLQLKETH